MTATRRQGIVERYQPPPPYCGNGTPCVIEVDQAAAERADRIARLLAATPGQAEHAARPALHPRAVEGPDGTLIYTCENGGVVTIPSWEQLNNKKYGEKVEAERQAKQALFPVCLPAELPVSEAARKWGEVTRLFPELADAEDRLVIDPRPPAMGQKAFRRLVGTICRPEGEALAAVLSPFIREIVRDELAQERQGA